MANAQRFFSTTTADKRSALESAWEDAQANQNGNLRKQLRCYLRESGGESSGGQVIQSSSSNNHSGTYADPGTGAPAPAEIPRMWQDLVDRYDRAKQFITFCDAYGLDAFEQKFCQQDLSDLTPVKPAVIVDTKGRWARLCSQFSIAPATVVSAAISDSAIFIWMMDNLVAITEARSDYGNLRLTGGLQYV